MATRLMPKREYKTPSMAGAYTNFGPGSFKFQHWPAKCTKHIFLACVAE